MSYLCGTTYVLSVSEPRRQYYIELTREVVSQTKHICSISHDISKFYFPPGVVFTPKGGGGTLIFLHP